MYDAGKLELCLVDGYQIGFSEEGRLVALLISTGSGDGLNAAMTSEAAIRMGEALIQAGERLQHLKERDN